MSTDRTCSGQRGHGTTRSRRALLTGTAAALGAIAAEILADTAPAQASPGQPVLQSRDNTGNTRRTAVFTKGKREWAQLADPNHYGLGSLGIYAHGQTYGVYADSGSHGTGVFGVGNGGYPGVMGISTDGPGVSGEGRGTSGGVVGSCKGTGAGVTGFGGDQGGTGVTGIGGINSGVGVSGIGTGGRTGVMGVSGGGSSDGVTGAATDTGNGMVGTAAGTGSGVLAQNTGVGPALNVLGPALFSRSGVLTVAAGSSAGTVSGVTVSGASLVLAILQEDLPGLYVRSAVPGAMFGFTVHLNKAAPAGARVAWFIVN
jgi:hypothetical protein